MNKAMRMLGVVASVGMFLVLVTGATVTNTGSEQGCGRSWPLCHGKLVPQLAAATAIEWSHRLDALIETLLILPLAAGVFILYRRRRELLALAATMVAFIFLQAGLGAWAVMYPQEAGILALHFGVSLIAFASVLLTTVLLFEMRDADSPRTRPLPAAFRRFAWLVTLYSYAVVYLGAYVRHAKADDACSGWPLCNGTLTPALRNGVAANFGHRLAAAVLIAAVAALVITSRRLRNTRPDVYRASLIALAAVCLQALSGAVVTLTDVDIFSALGHAASAGLLFGSLCYLCLHVRPLPSDEKEPALVSPMPGSSPLHVRAGQ